MRRSVGTLTLVIGFLASCGGGAGTEDPARADAAEGGALDASTEAGDGTSACTEGTSRCEDKVPVTCAKDGSWRRGAPCPYGCASGACTGLCVDGQKDCDGNVPLSCTSGTWQRGAACAGVCTRGVCESSCVSGESTCAQSLLLVCVGSSAWDTSQRCPYVCRDGACQGDCIPGAKQCAGDGRTPQVCGADGTWQGGERCAAACTDGTCTEGCVEGSAQCSGRTLLSCANGGTWGIAESCASVCTNGACRGECSPGAIRCGRDGTSVESCDGQGQWTHARTCAHGCEASGRCAATPEAGPDGAADAGSAEDAPAGDTADVGTIPDGFAQDADGGIPTTTDATTDAHDATVQDGGSGQDASTESAPPTDSQSSDAADAATEAGPPRPLYTCAFVGPRRQIADLAATQDTGQAQVRLLTDPFGQARVAYTSDTWNLVVATFDPATTVLPAFREYLLTTASPLRANLSDPVPSFVILHVSGNARRCSLLRFAQGVPEELVDIGTRPIEGQGRVPGGFASILLREDAGVDNILFGQAVANWDAGVAQYYAARTTPGAPVQGSLVGQGSTGEMDITGVMAFPNRAYMVPLSRMTGLPRLFGFPNTASFTPGDVTERTFSSTIGRGAFLLVHRLTDSPPSYEVGSLESSNDTVRLRLGIVNESNVDTFQFETLALLAEFRTSGSLIQDWPVRTFHGQSGMMLAGPLDSPRSGLSVRWYDSAGRVLVVPATDEGGTQPDLLPTVNVRSAAVVQDEASATPRFHAVWRAPTGAPGRDGIYFDNFECKP